MTIAGPDRAFQAFLWAGTGAEPGYPRFKERDRLSAFGPKEQGDSFEPKG